MIDEATLPGPDDLPVTEGPPTQDEPEGQELGGPHPDELDPSLRQAVEAEQTRLLEALRGLPAPELAIVRGLVVPPQVTSERVIAAAQALLGTGESPSGSNCNAITQRCGLGCVAWCDETWWTALFNAGFNDGNGHVQMPGVTTDYWFGDAYVPNTMRHFQAAGRFSADPVPGAGEIHFWGGGEGNSHIACYVKDFGNGTHLNIEGNEGNVCQYVRRSNVDSTRMGYCIPVFSSVPTPTPVDTVPAYVLEEGMFSVPPDGQPHNFPIPSWAKVVKPLSNGTNARAVILDRDDKPLVTHEKDWYAANEVFEIAIPAGAQCFGATNFGPEQSGQPPATLEVIYDIA